MNYPFFIAKRYLQTTRRSALVFTIISIVSVNLGVWGLVGTLSVMNGFETELRQRIIAFNTNVVVFTRNPDAWVHADTLVDLVQAQDHVVAMAPFVRSEALVAYEVIPGRRTRIRGVIVKGVDLAQEALVSTVIDSIKPQLESFDASFFDDEEPHVGVVLGIDLAIELRVGLGEEVSLVTAPQTIQGSKVEPEVVKCRVLGFFNSGMYEFDSRFVYMDMREANALFDFETALRGYSIQLDDIYKAQEVDRELQAVLSLQHYGTNNWINMNANLFTYIKIEKLVMSLLLLVITVIGSFSLVGMLTMLTARKRREIGILKAMGASTGRVMFIFMLAGTAIGVAGTITGLVNGLIFCYIVDRIGVNLPGDVYFIKTLPVIVQWRDLLMISGSAILICFFATILPSWLGARLLPVETIRNA